MALFKKKSKASYSRGMTYVELVVVLGIFAVMSNVVLFNYGGFQAKVDIKNLANDIALKIVEAQKSSLAGRLPPAVQQGILIAGWKPSYGVYMNLASDNKSFIYFTDANNNNLYDGSDCAGECSTKVSITKGNTISSLDVYYTDGTPVQNVANIAATFKRPNSGATITSTSLSSPNISYVQITISSLHSISAKIKLYVSGRIQIN